MIRKRPELDTVNPPGQIVNFEKPLVKEIQEWSGRCSDCSITYCNSTDHGCVKDYERRTGNCALCGEQTDRPCHNVVDAEWCNLGGG